MFGVSIYFYLPMALLRENYHMMLQIFFLILLGMLFGLTLLAMNFLGILETLLIKLLLFWESKSMKAMLYKNLIAHKQRNLLTSIIYSLTLGSIIFLVVSANLQLQQITDLNTIENADIAIGDFSLDKKDSEESLLFASTIDSILMKYENEIRDFGFVTGELVLLQSDKGDNFITNKSRLAKPKSSSVQALSPSRLLDESLYLSYEDATYDLGVTEQLYTARGSQGVGISERQMKGAGANPAIYSDTFLFENTNYEGFSTHMLLRPLFSIGHRPDYYMGNKNYLYMSLTKYSYLAEKDLDEIPFKYLLIRLNDPSNHALTD